MKKNALVLVVLLFLGIFLGSCNGKSEEILPTEIPTEVPLPSPTPALDRVVLVTGDNPDSWMLQQATSTLQGLAQNSSLEFETRTNIQSNEITSDMKVLVFLSHPQNLGSLSNGAPDAQFIVISDEEWVPSSNVTIIRSDTKYQYFMAGYASVMLAENFRSGALLPIENGDFNTAYKNGAKYFCGICNAVISPLNAYPITRELSSSSAPADWINAFEEIRLNSILYVFVPPAAYSADLFNYIAQSGAYVIGIAAPPAEAQAVWAGTFLSDGISPITDIWNDVMAGNGGKTVFASLYLEDAQNGFISQGKQQLLQQVISDIQAGMIFPLDLLSQ